MKRKAYLLAIFSIVHFSILAQEDPVQLANVYLDQANQIYSQQKEAIEIAKELYVQAADLDSTNIQANWMAGKLYLETINKDYALKYLKRIESQQPAFRFDLLYYIGRAHHYGLDFDKSLEYYQRYKKRVLSRSGYRGKDRVSLEKVNRRILECTNAKDIIDRPAQYSIVPLNEGVNSQWPDYAPVINRDETMLIFTSRRQEENTSPNVDKDNFYFEDVFVSYKKSDGTWGPAENIGPPINTEYHDANIALSNDGTRLYLYKDTNMGDIYYSDYDGQSWSEPEYLSNRINASIFSENSVSETASSDVIIYTSSRTGGEGGIDIYYCIKDDKGEWYKSKSLGGVINTKYDDDSPFLAADGKTLYFSSMGHKGYGGYDIFKSVYDSAAGEWSDPENLGYPVNTPDDEIYFQVSEDGRRAYFASVREGGVGFTDIFMVKYHGSKSGDQPSVVLAEGGNQISTSITAQEGKAPDEPDFSEAELKLIDDTHKIYFNTDQSSIREDHAAELDSIVQLINTHKLLDIDIAGFASSDGNPKYNLDLSHKRALIVLDYFLEKGVDEERIVARGYGSIDEDSSAEEQRRAEVRIVSRE